jgi:hypothetical protein
MTEELLGALRVIHDLEKAIRVWELVRDSVQRVVNETAACWEMHGDCVKTNLTIARARAGIATYNRAILGAKTRIEEMERSLGIKQGKCLTGLKQVPSP